MQRLGGCRIVQVGAVSTEDKSFVPRGLRFEKISGSPLLHFLLVGVTDTAGLGYTTSFSSWKYERSRYARTFP
jgi:hypothetical protein